MAVIVPFRGIFYNVGEISLEDVLAPPYDIISPEYREVLYKKSPYNIVRIDFGKEFPTDTEKENKYTRARKFLNTWLDEGILLKSIRPCFYAYEMSYKINGEEKHLRGFLGIVKLEELGKGSIFPHECTYSKPKQDRFNLLRTCEANISPIFSLYKSKEKLASNILSKISSEEPYLKASDADGAIHKIWPIDETEKINIIKKELEDKAVFIADGHHRYETAYEFHREMLEKNRHIPGTKPFDYVLMFLVNMLDEGISVLPTHRLIKDVPHNVNTLISEYFEIEPVKGNFDIAKILLNKKRVFGFFPDNDKAWYLLKYKGGNLSEINHDLRDIDVFILHELILKKILHTGDIGYEMDINTAIRKVRSGKFGAAFFLNPTKVEDVERAALSAVRMPPKSTYFYPKLLTGLVFHKWETDFSF